MAKSITVNDVHRSLPLSRSSLLPFSPTGGCSSLLGRPIRSLLTRAHRPMPKNTGGTEKREHDDDWRREHGVSDRGDEDLHILMRLLLSA